MYPMVDINDLYCSIFTDAAVKIEVLINKVAELTTGNAVSECAKYRLFDRDS
ncbi:hypothetical protein PghCCS26_41970 [Paenibacillus glycanilyticus]|uniref:Uncharacterized protein n=1 Tax=Paenibacillus glycanilyticus TaxID=126569 RepID=A0ABQ6NPP4_9BACL|nr:hypothetical protein PghCCS26_41970 [Paenibacillus glycanilyticus]